MSDVTKRERLGEPSTQPSPRFSPHRVHAFIFASSRARRAFPLVIAPIFRPRFPAPVLDDPSDSVGDMMTQRDISEKLLDIYTRGTIEIDMLRYFL